MLVFSLFESWAHKDFQFARVIAKEESDGYFIPVFNPEEEFPMTGEISLHTSVLPDFLQKYSVAIWETVRTAEAIPGTRYREYRGRRYIGSPDEIISINYFSDQVDEARDFLIEGIELPFPVHGKVFIEFCDGIIAGPIRVNPIAGHGFCCDPSVFNNPLDSWRTRNSLDCIVYDRPGLLPRYFSSTIYSPQPEFQIDLAPIKQVLSSTLKFACKSGPGSYIISKKEQEELIERLGSLGREEKLDSRLQTVKRYFEKSKETGILVDSYFDYISKMPEVLRNIEELKAKTADEEKNKIFEQHSGKLKEIELLNFEINNLKNQISALRSEQQLVMSRSESIVVESEKILKAKLDQISNDAQDFLSQVLLMRPFLGQNSRQYTNDSLLIRETGFETEELIDDNQVLEVLSSNLRSIGMAPKDAAALGREVLAAIYLGQLVMFEGSLGKFVANTVASTLSGKSICNIEVPVGACTASDMQRVLEKVRCSGNASALILDGINKSCISAYAHPLLSFITERYLTLNNSDLNKIIIGTIADGPSGLDIKANLTLYGPIFNTDCLSWKRGQGLDKIRKGSITSLEHRQWDRHENVDELNSIFDIIAFKEPSALWANNVRSLLDILNTFRYTEGEPTPLQSVFFGWILPRVIGCSVSINKFTDFVNKGKFLTEYPDARIIRLIGKTDLKEE